MVLDQPGWVTRSIVCRSNVAMAIHGLFVFFLTCLSISVFAGSGSNTPTTNQTTPPPTVNDSVTVAVLPPPPPFYDDECHGEKDYQIGTYVIDLTNQIDPFRCVREVVDHLSQSGNLVLRPEATGINEYQFGLPYLERVEGNLVIDGEDGWDEVYLPRLAYIGGDVTLFLNSAVEYVELTSMQSLNKLVVHMREMNNDLQGLNNVTQIQSLEFNNDNLDPVVDFDFTLVGLAAVTQLNYLRVKGVGIFNPNSNVQDDNILPALTQVSQDVNFDGQGLVRLYGVDSLQSVGGNLKISDSESLVNLQGLEDLQTIGGNLRLDHVLGLTSLNGLGAVTVSHIIIKDAPDLVDISALYNANVTSQVTFDNNQSLSCVDVNAYDLASPGVTVVIEANGCI